MLNLKKMEKLESPEPLQMSKQNLHLLSFAKKIVRIPLDNLLHEFGIDDEVLNNFNYLIKGTDIFFINKNWHDRNLNIFNRIGTRFGTIDKKGNTVLHTQAAQILDKDIKKNIYEIENSGELEIYLNGGIIKKELNHTGQCVVKYKNSIIGTAVITQQGLKSRFPRSKRTQEILI